MGKKSSKKKAPTTKAAVSKPSPRKSPPKKALSKPVKPARPAGAKQVRTSGTGGLISTSAEHTLDVATYVALHALVIAVPLAFGQFTFDQFDMPKVVTLRFISLALMVLWTARFLLSRRIEVRRTPLDWFILAFLAWVTLSTIFSVHLPTALLGKYRRYEGFISLMNYAVVFFVAVQTLRTYSRLRGLAKSMIVTGAVVGVYGIFQYFGYDFLQWGQLPFDQYRAFATYGNPDLLIGYLAVLVPIGIGLFVTTEDAYESAAYGLCTVVIFMSLMMTFSRSAWVGLGVAFPFLALVFWRQGILRRPQVILIGACVLLIVVGLAAYSYKASNQTISIIYRFKEMFDPSAGTAGTRVEIWKSSVAATKDRPVFGFGPDAYRLIFPRYKTVRYVQMAGYRSVADNAHSYPFQLAPAVGIPGVILFYIPVFFGFAKVVGLAWRRGGHESERVMIASFAAGALAYGIHLLFGLSVTGTTIFLWVAFAACMLPFVKTTEIVWRPGSTAIRFASMAVIGFLILAGTYLNYRFFVADVWNLRSYQYQQSNVDAAIAASDEALRLNPYWDAYRAQKAMLMMQKAGASNNRAEVLSTIKFLRKSIEESPREYDNYLFLTNGYSTASRAVDRRYLASSPDGPYATRSYDVDNPDNVPATALDVALYALRNVEPNAPSAMVQAGLIYFDLGLPRTALRYFWRAAKQDPRFGEAFFHLGRVYERLGKKRQALTAYKKAAEIAPELPGVTEAVTRIRNSSK